MRHVSWALAALALASPAAAAPTTIHYGPDPAQVLDLHLPARADRPSPLVVFIHGGGWASGTRATWAKAAATLARRGIAAATIDYRLAPLRSAIPRAFRDTRMAVARLRAHPRIDPARIALAGDSAGGHLALMGARQPGVKAVAALSPPTRLTGWQTAVVPLLAGSPAALVSMSPATRPAPRVAVSLTFYTADPLVDWRDQGLPYARRLRAAGVRLRLQVHAEPGHGLAHSGADPLPSLLAWLERRL